MATRAKNSPPGKEKGRISPTIPRPTASSSTDQKHDSTSSEKRIPNYLKPTRSSAGLASSSGAANKPTLSRRRSFGTSPPPQTPKTRTSAADKPTLARRRSFDHRQPPLQPPKMSISSTPGERHLQSSSSSSAKSSTITSQKGLSARYSKEPKPASVRKSSNGATKQDNEIKSMKMKAPTESSTDKGDDPDILQLPEEDQQSLLTDEEVTIYALSKTEMPGEDIEMEDKKHSAIEVEDKEHIEVIHTEPEVQDHKDTKETESSAAATVQIETSYVKMEEPEDQNSLIEEISVNIPEPEPSPAVNSIDSTKENPASESEAENQEKGVVEDANEAPDKEREAKEASEPVKASETEEVKNAAPDQVKQDPQIAVAKRQLPIQAKKEATVSNDVIEETASKLREQRKNKVKALAGAFETVISLQDPK